MTDEIKIWAINEEAKSVEPVQQSEWQKTEATLESVIVKNPGMLLAGLTLVGRQTPTESGYLDLLGVNSEGRLVVFELKRGKLTRDAIAQAIDYCSDLESMAEPELMAHIAECSGKNGTTKIENFEAWYYEQFEGIELAELRPPKMVLVGLGADVRAQRMTRFLADSGVDISILTFHGYECEGRTLLARHMEGSEARNASSNPRKQTQAERRQHHARRAEGLGIAELWRDTANVLNLAHKEYVTKSGITFYQRKITLPDDVRVSGSHSVVIDDQVAMVRVTFYPGAVDICWERFHEESKKIPFDREPSRNAPKTKKVSDQWCCLLDAEKWEIHKEALVALANDVASTWRQKRGEARTNKGEGAA